MNASREWIGWIKVRATFTEDGLMRIVASTQGEASDGHIYVQSGADFKRYRDVNPLFLWGHDMGSWFMDTPAPPSVGKAVSVGLEGGTPDTTTPEEQALMGNVNPDPQELRMSIRFASDIDEATGKPYHPFARQLEYQYRNGFLHDVSVGVQFLKTIRRSDLEEDHPWFSERGLVVLRWRLRETSGCVMGADGAAGAIDAGRTGIAEVITLDDGRRAFVMVNRGDVEAGTNLSLDELRRELGQAEDAEPEAVEDIQPDTDTDTRDEEPEEEPEPEDSGKWDGWL